MIFYFVQCTHLDVYLYSIVLSNFLALNNTHVYCYVKKVGQYSETEKSNGLRVS